MSDDVDDFIAHFGKKGMKWGVTTTDRGGSAPTGSAPPMISRREARAINKAGERQYNEQKIAEVYNESKTGGERVLVKSRAAGDYADTIMTGKQFTEHVERGGLIDSKTTRIFARQSKEGEQFVLNNFAAENYVPIKRK